MRLASSTRDLEQEYTKHVFEMHSKRVAGLQREISILNKRIEEMQHSNREELRNSETLEELDELRRLLALEQSRANEAIVDLKLARSRCEELEKEIRNISECRYPSDSMAVPASTKHDTALIEQVSNTQKEILRIVHTMWQSLEEGNKTASHVEELVKQNLLKRKDGSLMDTALEKRLLEREKELEKLRDENLRLQEETSLERTAREETKSTIVLLRSTIDSKDKVIQRQMSEIERLKKLAHNPFGEQYTDRLACIAENRKDINEPKHPKKKKLQNEKTGSSNKKNIDITKLIKNENRSFFNNLSFTNSSPMPDKKAGKK